MADAEVLLTWRNEAPLQNQADAAKAICCRRTGIGADGWLLVSQPSASDKEFDAAIQLFNSDGSSADQNNC